ncbi:LamG domain-containing protein [Candidatus Marsarchaeota archaeon]|nr:LamG domain-containing protein [Candidatus Marsarchaeota archaeon]
MEMIRSLSGKKGQKAQLFSIAALLFGLMVISALLVFVVINIGYDQISQSSIISSSSSNLGMVLGESADAFASSSGSAALGTLYLYESNASLRGRNFITNFSEFMQYLMVNGTLPNVQKGSNAANAISRYMRGATFASYNSEISNINGSGSKQVSINETLPQISQDGPYSISIAYTEHVSVNTTTGRQSFSIPVSTSISLNDTPDMLYAQQGIYMPVRPASISGLVSVIGNDYASYSNTNPAANTFVYGTVYSIPSPQSCSITISGKINNPNYNSQIIIATVNAIAITAPSCTVLDKYGGLITESISGSADLGIPYLVFPESNNALQSVRTGQKLLLYEPGMSLLDISGLRNAIDSGDFLPSPFGPSYMQRASGNLYAQSPSGIFTYGGYGIQAPYFNSTLRSNSIVLSESQNSVVSYTISAWVYPTSQNGMIIGTYGRQAHSLELGIGSSQPSLVLPGRFFFGDVNSGTAVGVNTLGQFQLHRWYFVVGTFNSIPGNPVAPSQFRLYVNGANASVSQFSSGSDTSPLTSTAGMQIGGYGYNGMIADVQAYDSALTPAQIYRLYLNGMDSLPVTGSELAGWYPLDGNANDMSGNGNYPISTELPNYMQIPSYMRDSALPATASHAYPIPGTSNCYSNIQCVNYTLPHLYLGNGAMELNNGRVSAAYFNGQTSYFEQSGNFISQTVYKPFSISLWVYPVSGTGVIVGEQPSQTFESGLNQPIMELYGGELYINIWKNQCVKVGPVPTGEWSNLVFVYDGGVTGGKYYGYINANPGSDFGAGNGPTQGTSPMFYILGAGSANSCKNGLPDAGQPFQGLMANYQLYNISLLQQQVNQIYAGGIDGTPLTTSNTLGWWPLNGNGAEYMNQNPGFGNSLSYEFIQLNYSEANSPAVNPIGLSSVSGVGGEWQSTGFPAPAFQQVRWNVTAWTLPSNVKYISTQDVESDPLDPGGTTANQIGSFFSGVPSGDQGWSFASAQYRGTNFFGSAATPFPQSLGVLNSNVSCSEPFNSTGYTAAVNLTLSGEYNFSIAYNHAMAVFFRKVGGNSWSQVFNIDTTWPTTPSNLPQSQGPVSVTLNGEYQLVVDWNNGCKGGLSTFLMTKG